MRILNGSPIALVALTLLVAAGCDGGSPGADGGSPMDSGLAADGGDSGLFDAGAMGGGGCVPTMVTLAPESGTSATVAALVLDRSTGACSLGQSPDASGVLATFVNDAGSLEVEIDVDFMVTSVSVGAAVDGVISGLSAGTEVTASVSNGSTWDVTFPFAFDATAAVVTVTSTATTIRLLARLVDSGLVEARTAARWAERVEGPSKGDVPAEVVTRELEEGRRLVPPVFALARRTHEGAEARVGATITSTPPGGMGGATGLPLGVGVALLLEGDIDVRGVQAPEAVVPIERFFSRLAPLCAPAREGMPDLLRVARSWD